MWESKPRCVHGSLSQEPRGLFSSQLGLLGSREECHCFKRLLAQELCFALDGPVLLVSNSWALKSYCISRLGLAHDETQSEFLLLSFSFPTRDQIHPLAVEAQSPNRRQPEKSPNLCPNCPLSDLSRFPFQSGQLCSGTTSLYGAFIWGVFQEGEKKGGKQVLRHHRGGVIR